MWRQRSGKAGEEFDDTGVTNIFVMDMLLAMDIAYMSSQRNSLVVTWSGLRICVGE